MNLPSLASFSIAFANERLEARCEDLQRSLDEYHADENLYPRSRSSKVNYDRLTSGQTGAPPGKSRLRRKDRRKSSFISDQILTASFAPDSLSNGHWNLGNAEVRFSFNVSFFRGSELF